VPVAAAPRRGPSGGRAEPRWTEPRLGFWMAPAPIDTFEAVAPFRSATGMPLITAQDPPQALLDTERRVPPEPPKDTNHPPTFARHVPPPARGEPFTDDPT